MNFIPAIDLLEGRCVRLMQGNYSECTYYDAQPQFLAERYQAQGAEWLHVVDLAAARDRGAADTAALFDLLRVAPQKVQTGGGVRSGSDVQARLDAGAARVVVGSLCATETDRVLDWLTRFGADRVVAALDVRVDARGLPWPRIYGWTEDARVDLWTMLDRLCEGGLVHGLITDIQRDGAMHGPNVGLYEEIVGRYPGLQVQASGGVGNLQDLTALKASGAAAVISGKALLENVFTVPQALGALA